MEKSDFFEGIKQVKIQWHSYQTNIPVFYRDMMNLNVLMLAPLNKIRSILPSTRMNPYRVTPWLGVVSISAYEYRETDIGPYNEVMISIPFLLDRISPIFTGVLRKSPEVPMVYIHKLPVTTEVARAAGIESANFPKFIAEITFESENKWISCKAEADGKNILTLSVRKTQLNPIPRDRFYPITISQNRLLRLEFNLSECKAGSSKNNSDFHLELGNHPVGLELKELGLGKVLLNQYCPVRQAILVLPCESYPV